MILALLLVGCPKRSAEPGIAPSAPEVPGAPVTERFVTGPVRVQQEAPPHLCFDVPAGWTGTVSSTARFVEIGSAEGYRIAIATAPPGGAFPLEREGHRLMFDDAGSYRRLPVAVGGGTRAWTSEDPLGDYVRAWYTTVRGVPVEVSVAYPHGKVTEGEGVVEPVLRGWCSGASARE